MVGSNKKTKETIVAFDCTKFPPLKKSESSKTNQSTQPINGASDSNQNISSILSLNNKNKDDNKELFSQVKFSMDKMKAESLFGKDRRRFLEQMSLSSGASKPQKPPRVPSKILNGMRLKAKKREIKERDNKEEYVHFNSEKIRPPRERYEMRGKEKKRVKEHERGLMLSRSLKKRQNQKIKPFKPPK